MNNKTMHNEAAMARYLTMILDEALRDEENLLFAITNIEISPDQSYAWITVNTLGSTEEKQELVDFLNEHKAGIRTELAGYMSVKRVPELTFKPDLSREDEEEIDAVLAMIKAEEKSDEEEVIVVNKEKSPRSMNRISSLKATNDEWSLKNNRVYVKPMTVKSPRSSSNKMPKGN